jgi:hypothetical protein
MTPSPLIRFHRVRAAYHRYPTVRVQTGTAQVRVWVRSSVFGSLVGDPDIDPFFAD